MAVGTQACLAWVLGTDGRGSYAVAMLFLIILNMMFVIGCEFAGAVFVASRKLNLSEGVIYTFVLGGIGSLLAIIIGLIIMRLPFSFLSKASPLAFHLALVGIPIMVFSATLPRLMMAVREFNWFAIVTIIHNATHLLFVLLFVWFFSLGVEGALLGLLFSGLVTIIVSLVLFRRKYGLKWEKPALASLFEMFHYGLRDHLSKISNQMNLRAGALFLAFFAGRSDIGLFAVAVSFTTRVMIIPDVLVGVLIPRVANNDSGRAELVAQGARLVGLICGGLLLIVAVFARPIVTILFSPDFIPVVPLIRILAVGVVIRSSCKVFVPYLLGINHPGIASIAAMVSALVNLSLLWILMPIIGLAGAAVSMAIGYITGAAILMFSFNLFSRLSLGEIWRYRYSDWMVLEKFIKKAYIKIAPQKAG